VGADKAGSARARAQRLGAKRSVRKDRACALVRARLDSLHAVDIGSGARNGLAERISNADRIRSLEKTLHSLGGERLARRIEIIALNVWSCLPFELRGSRTTRGKRAGARQESLNTAAEVDGNRGAIGIDAAGTAVDVGVIADRIGELVAIAIEKTVASVVGDTCILEVSACLGRRGDSTSALGRSNLGRADKAADGACPIGAVCTARRRAFCKNSVISARNSLRRIRARRPALVQGARALARGVARLEDRRTGSDAIACVNNFTLTRLALDAASLKASTARRRASTIRTGFPGERAGRVHT